MYFLDEIPNNIIKRNPVILPINDHDRKKGSAIILLTPNFESSMNVLQSNLIKNRYYYSYFLRRSVLYYIDGTNEENLQESSNILLEDYEKLFDKLSIEINYKGLENDIKEVNAIIDENFISEIKKSLPVLITVPKRIDCEVYRGGILREPTPDLLLIESYYTFNRRIFKDYKSFIKFNTYVYIIKRNNPAINRSLLYAVSLIKSGLYDLCEKSWPFAKDLKILCDCINKYIARKGENTLFKELLLKNNDIKEIVRLLALYIDSNIPVNNVLDIFNIDLLYEELEMTDSGTSFINESYFSKQLDKVRVNDKECFIFENTAYNPILKKALYKDRIKTIKDLAALYNKAKEAYPAIKYTYPLLSRYKSLNLIYDTYYYNETYMRNTTFKNIKGYNIYSDLMERLILDKELSDNGYTNKTVIIPVNDWYSGSGRMHMIQDGINPVSCLYKTIITNPTSLSAYGNINFMFLGQKAYFTLNFSKVDINKVKASFIRNIKILLNNVDIIDDDEREDESSPKAIKDEIINKVEKTQNVKIDSLNKEDIKPNEDTLDKETEEIKADKKKELVDKIDKVSKSSPDIDVAMNKLDDDEMKDIIDFLADNPDDGTQLSATRKSRNLKLQNDLLNKTIKGKSIRDILDVDLSIPEYEDDLSSYEEPLELAVDSVNDEWKDLKFPVAENKYNIDDDIVRAFDSFSRVSNPLYIRDISAEDTSTSEDAIDTYTVKYESEKGERFTVVLDIPKFVDGKYLKLRGNRKELPNQLFLMPIIKTDETAVQVVSNYNKIFVKLFNASIGKSIIPCGKLIKILTKNKYKGIKVVEGMNKRVCSKYQLPIDYIDIARVISKVVTKNYTFYFNQDELRSKYGDQINDKKGIPFAYDTKNNKVEYYTSKNGIFSEYLALMISTQVEGTTFYKDYIKASKSTKYSYSRCSIMNTNIPLIVVCAYSEGLDKVLQKAGINYELSEERPKDLGGDWDYIKFKDGYLSFKVDYDSSLLLNGLRDCPVYDTSITDLNKRITYLGYLDQFGGRILADGLDNFYDLLIDPDTYNQLKAYKLPTDYVSILLYASQLLADNKYIKHTNITGNRQLKRKQQIVDLLYKVLAREYSGYSTSIKHGRSRGFSVKQTALIDAVMQLNTTSDLSILNPMGEYESYNAVTPKGNSGMNSDRSYGLDKRSYDDSMLGVLSLSTGFAGNVGIVRQATIDANVDKYGRIHSDGKKELNPVKTMCMTEALTPFGVTNEDPMRVAMNFIQSSKHSMRCEDSDPLLITTGADEALPYLVSNTFSFKTKDDGVVKEKTDKYMVLEYKDGTFDFVSLENKVEKNSSNGFYVDIKLDSDMKVGQKFKQNDIVAYDKLAYSNKTGTTDNIEYNIGPLIKIAFLNTDEGYEDSAIISERLSERMTTDVVLPVTKAIPKEANIFNMIKEGQFVREGDTLFTIQAASDDEYVDQVMRNLSLDDGDIINELGRTSVKASITGTVEKIVIKRTCEKNQLSDTLLKLCNKYEGNINTTKNIMKKYNIDTSSIESTDKLPNQGKLKKVDGIYMEIYIKYRDKMSVGDKLIYYSAVKGVVKDIFPEGDEPYSEYRKDEKMDSLLSLGSINARMVMSGVKAGAINKGIIELTRQCKDILGIKYKL